MLYLSQVIGRPVRDRNGESIGKVADLIVAIGDRYPPVTGLVVTTEPPQDLPALGRRGEPSTCRGARLNTAAIDIGKFHQRPNELLLQPDLQDKQIVDIDGRRGRARERPAARRDRGQAPPRRRRRRRHRAPAPARHRGPLPDGRPEPPPARAGALHRLGGRGPGRDVDRRRPPARASRRASPSSTRPTSRRSSTS